MRLLAAQVPIPHGKAHEVVRRLFLRLDSSQAVLGQVLDKGQALRVDADYKEQIMITSERLQRYVSEVDRVLPVLEQVVDEALVQAAHQIEEFDRKGAR